MTEVSKEDIIEDYAKQFCRRHRDRSFNPECDDCCDSYQLFLEYRRDAIYEVIALLRDIPTSSVCDCITDLEDIADGRD
jgi:hypothetical protein